LGVSEHICLPGYVSTDELTVLYQSARALIFPSLYEGFGMPVLEAMANGVPVLCSNMTSLPEVAGDAALFFDPRSPKSIAQAIETILNASSQQKQDLIQKGHARVKFFGDAKRMAHEYALVLEKTLAESPAIKHDR
jgi:glycosyltransferase involved in cell wall biosynthesis